jgi:hypothetical protein
MTDGLPETLCDHLFRKLIQMTSMSYEVKKPFRATPPLERLGSIAIREKVATHE